MVACWSGAHFVTMEWTSLLRRAGQRIQHDTSARYKARVPEKKRSHHPLVSLRGLTHCARRNEVAKVLLAVPAICRTLIQSRRNRVVQAAPSTSTINLKHLNGWHVRQDLRPHQGLVA